MAVSKKEEFNKQTQQLANLAKAISHPARIQILLKLAKSKTCICGELVDVLPLSQSTVSQHLKELKEAGLIDGRIDGPRSCFCINQKALELFNNQFGEMIKALKK